MKYAFILVLFLSQNSYSQNIVGYTFSNKDQKNPFPTELSPFSTDGCTRYGEGPDDNNSKWLHCCTTHDSLYWLGGTEEERLAADEGLSQCVKDTGHPTRAKIMYTGTRIGGGPLRHTTYRWGFGWNRIRNYSPITENEKKMAEELYGENLEGLKNAIKENKFPMIVPDSYDFIPNFEYTFCEEEIIKYLSPKIKKSTTVTSFRDYSVGQNYTVSLGLDSCTKKIEFTFSGSTDKSSCKRDFVSSKHLNKIVSARMPKDCVEKN